MKRIDRSEFIKRSNFIHKSKYDYSLVEYKNNRTKVKIVCDIHGIFEQIPESHMKGHGCSKCANNHNYNNSEFIEKIREIFGDKYKYNEIEYSSHVKKVKIICDTHGVISKYPQSLLKGSGCNKCESVNYKIDKDEFIRRAFEVHGKTYKYNEVEYVNDSTPIRIICDTHGIFEQSPNIHLSGHGCKYCSGRYRYSNEEFIEKSNFKHNCKYDYTRVDYKNAHTKVKIICKKHGEFSQKPNAHLIGNGCPSCKESKGELLIFKFLEENKIQYNRQKTFKGCKYKSLLFFDFYIPSMNLCIEYDGEFHYLPIFGEKYLSETIKRDIIKNQYCLNNNIDLLRISYRDVDNISEILKLTFNI